MWNHVIYISTLANYSVICYIINISISPGDKVRDSIDQQPSEEQNGYKTISLSLSLSLSLYLSIYLSIRRPSVLLSVCLSIYMYLSICLPLSILLGSIGTRCVYGMYSLYVIGFLICYIFYSLQTWIFWKFVRHSMSPGFLWQELCWGMSSALFCRGMWPKIWVYANHRG